MRILALTFASLATSLAASDFRLGFPVDCNLGEDCFIQNYVDQDAGQDYQDFSCGRLSYDGHKGTDFAVATHREALHGVAILAAAPGQVRAIRESITDHFLDKPMAFPEGQDCGNGVVIRHEDGWETQYCHLKLGSIQVQAGQQVEAGTVLGEIGMTGRTEFPHLHLSVRHQGNVIDPFNPEGLALCDTTGTPLPETLWNDSISYEAGGLLDAGFAFGLPEFNHIKWGDAHYPHITAEQGALVLWAYVFGGIAGDALTLTIEGPDGVFSEQTVVLERTQAQLMRASGRRLHAENTVPGDYTGTVVLMREGEEIDRLTATTELRE